MWKGWPQVDAASLARGCSTVHGTKKDSSSSSGCLPSSIPFVVEGSNHPKEEFHPPNDSRHLHEW